MEEYGILWRSLSTQLLMPIPKEPNDLTMSSGDIIDIVGETNADWWTGRNRGKQGLFPSNYVQKLPPEPSSQLFQEKPHDTPGYANHGDHPPPQQMNPGDNTPAVNSIGLQPNEGQDKKKDKFGKFGNTVRSFSFPSLTALTELFVRWQMAHSAAGGLGALFRYPSMYLHIDLQRFRRGCCCRQWHHQCAVLILSLMLDRLIDAGLTTTMHTSGLLHTYNIKHILAENHRV